MVEIGDYAESLGFYVVFGVIPEIGYWTVLGAAHENGDTHVFKASGYGETEEIRLTYNDGTETSTVTGPDVMSVIATGFRMPTE